ncbi:Uncharacterised protein [Mycobacteroides abscessus subsp. massiliense]|uniref:hypothetical protein n=1 Tax=Mycobacteroides abscessus TaxID=36809 RepID=UPI0009A6B9AF|nr:hypothetical protein [Mycobacteroides abscessus]SKH29443.1 Uncharacterised protein [Mycobacteroides abscessus subsp. massiliense]
MDELISRIDGLLDEVDDIPWVDSMRWAPAGVELPEGVWDDQPEGELDSGWDYHSPAQIHVIPSDQVDDWIACLDTMPVAERDDVAWYVVCFQCMKAGERTVDCGCRNPSSEKNSR